MSATGRSHVLRPAHLLLALGLAGTLALSACGHENDEDPDTATDGGSSAGESPTGSPTDGSSPTAASEPWRLVTLKSGSNVGGKVGPPASVDDTATVNQFLSQFGPADSSDPATRFVNGLQTAIDKAEPGPDRGLAAAVVDVSCEPPKKVRVTGSGERLRVEAVKTGKNTTQCLVPITTVAVVEVDRAKLPPTE